MDAVDEGRERVTKNAKDSVMKMTVEEKESDPQPKGGRIVKIVLFNLVGIYNDW